MKRMLILTIGICFSLLSNTGSNAQVIDLWGTNFSGGPIGTGTLFKIKSDGSGYVNAPNFAIVGPYSTLSPLNGNQLYGMSFSGGTNFAGSIFRYNLTTGNAVDVFSFNTVQGQTPLGSLFLASNNKFYGTTGFGGNANRGVLFCFDPSNSQYTILHHFDTLSGWYPQDGVMQASDGKLYGMTNGGGVGMFGTIYSYDIVNSIFSVEKSLYFADGASPFGTLVQHTNGLLYGLAFGGGATGYGTIISFDIVNHTQAVVHSFLQIEGAAPMGSLLLDASGLFYGMTSQGGIANKGTIFSYNVNSNILTKLHDFNITNGASPGGSLIKGSDGKFYGMTSFGGTDNRGVVFKFDPVGNVYTKLHDGNLTAGAIPQADLIEFYPTTSIGENISGDWLSVYPNPATDFLEIRIDDFVDIRGMTVVVFDQKGAELFVMPITNRQFTMEAPDVNGLYRMTVFDGNNRALLSSSIVCGH